MKSQPITLDIKKAIWAWIQADKLTQTQVANLLGVKTQSVNQWLSGMAKNIRARNWESLYPNIEKYLPPDFTTHGHNSPIIVGDHAVGVVHGSISGSNIGGGSSGNPQVENFRRQIQDVIMASDLDGEIKVKVYQLIGKV